VGDGVLNDQRGQPLGMREGQTKPDRAAVVLQVQGVARDVPLLQESIDDLGEAIEGIAERTRRRRVTASEPRVVRGDQMKSVGQSRHEIAEHDRRRGEAVQQDERRIARVTGLTVKDAQTFDRRRVVPNRGQIAGSFVRCSVGHVGRSSPALGRPSPNVGFRRSRP
jgi:hypothetical protein